MSALTDIPYRVIIDEILIYYPVSIIFSREGAGYELFGRFEKDKTKKIFLIFKSFRIPEYYEYSTKIYIPINIFHIDLIASGENYIIPDGIKIESASVFDDDIYLDKDNGCTKLLKTIRKVTVYHLYEPRNILQIHKKCPNIKSISLIKK